MLVLSRKNNEKILIGDNITLTLFDIKDGRVKVAIDAPREINVVRAEILNPDSPRVNAQASS